MKNSPWKIVAILLFVFVFVSSGARIWVSSRGDLKSMGLDLLSESLNYANACSHCHGKKGEGKTSATMLSKTLLIQRYKTRDAVRALIQYGLPEKGMPAFDQQYSTAQLDGLAEFILTFEP